MKDKLPQNDQTLSRRELLSTALKGGVGAAALIGSVALVANGCQNAQQSGPPEPSAKSGKAEPASNDIPVLYKLGCQHFGATRRNLEFLSRYGVFNFDPGMPKMIEGVGWDLDDSLRLVDACAEYGISLDAYHLPLSSAGIDRVSSPNIMLGKSPERDREIEMIQQMIEVAGKSGVRTLLYNTTILPVTRLEPTVDPTRGNSRYHTWNWKEAEKRPQPRTIAGDVDVDEVFERITYLLDRLLPVAEEYDVRLGNHIADPPMPAAYRGVMRWNSPDVFAGIKRFAELYDSPSHGFNLCLGSISEGLNNPRKEILPIIKWVGERKQIFNIHLRNIKGGFNNYMEVFPDNGDLDFAEILRALRDVGFDGMVMPDHIPKHDDPASDLQGHAFAFGYIRALMQTI